MGGPLIPRTQIGDQAKFTVGWSFFGALAFSIAGCSMIAAGNAQPKFLAALEDDDPDRAARALDDALKAPNGGLPDRHHSFTGLLLAERGTVRLAGDDPNQSIRDLSVADKMLDLDDLTLDTWMLRYGLPSSARHGYHMGWFGALNTPYVPRLHERLMVNPLEMISDLDIGDDNAARVEARRFDVMIDFAKRTSPNSPALKTRALSGILAGFAFEQSAEKNEACLRYRDATSSTDVDLSAVGPGGKAPDACTFASSANKPFDATRGEILIVVAYGLVPHAINETVDPKVPKFALTGGNDTHEDPTIRIDGDPVEGVEVLSLANIVRDDWDQATREVGGSTTPLSWSTLPARFVLARVMVPAGTHEVDLGVRRVTKHVNLRVIGQGYAAASLVVLR